MAFSFLFQFVWISLFASASALLESSPQFSLNSEDGQISYSCKAHRRPGGGPDWDLSCGTQRFAVHLYVRRLPQANQLSKYQILYWVLDYNERPDSSLAGTYHGTNMTFILSDHQSEKSVYLSQVVQTTWNLETILNL